jgi:hypothetical protein
VTVYTDLLGNRLGRSAGGTRAVGALVADLLTRRARLLGPAGQRGAVIPAIAVSGERLLQLLDYDESLVRLCDELGVKHRMLDPFATAGAREEAERALTRRVPLLAILGAAPAG